MSNIVNDSVENYIREILSENTGLLKELELYALENQVPIIHKEVAELLKVVLNIHRPKKILEIGCAIGYSSIFFVDCLGGDCQVITTERNPAMIQEAKKNIERSGFSKNIKILIGNAEETLDTIDGEFDCVKTDRDCTTDKINVDEPDTYDKKFVDSLSENEKFDMVFIDAAKGQYQLFFDKIFDKVKSGGLIISDNILYKGMIASDEFVVRRKKTIVKRMRSYLNFICNNDEVETSIIPIGDGLAISYKK